MKKVLLILSLVAFIHSNAQLPFNYRTAKTVKSKVQKSASGTETAVPDDDDNAAFFDDVTAAVLMTDDGSKLFPTLNSSIIKYRFAMYSKKTKDKIGNDVFKRTYLPFFVTSNVSGASLSENKNAEVNEVTSYMGSILNFRAAPAFKIKVGDDNSLVIGTSHDLRLYAIGDTVTQKVSASFGYYGAVGLSYFGFGQVDDGEGNQYDGRFGMSALIYWFKSGGKFNEKVFGNAEAKDWLTGFEFLLKFKPDKSEASKFKLFAAAKYDFSSTSPTKNTWSFRFGIGN